jgi:hypothetical protein
MRTRCKCCDCCLWGGMLNDNLAQVVDEILDAHAASRMGIDQIGQICVMIHRYI